MHEIRVPVVMLISLVSVSKLYPELSSPKHFAPSSTAVRENDELTVPWDRANMYDAKTNRSRPKENLHAPRKSNAFAPRQMWDAVAVGEVDEWCYNETTISEPKGDSVSVAVNEQAVVSIEWEAGGLRSIHERSYPVARCPAISLTDIFMAKGGPLRHILRNGWLPKSYHEISNGYKMFMAVANCLMRATICVLIRRFVDCRLEKNSVGCFVPKRLIAFIVLAYAFTRISRDSSATLFKEIQLLCYRFPLLARVTGFPLLRIVLRFVTRLGLTRFLLFVAERVADSLVLWYRFTYRLLRNPFVSLSGRVIFPNIGR